MAAGGVPAAAQVHVEGLRELQRALNKVSRESAKTVREELKRVAEPVRGDAEMLAQARIRNIGSTWSRIKVGTRPGQVYIAPKSRRRGGSPRPNLSPLLLDRAMWPAVEGHQALIEHRVEVALYRLGQRAGF